MVAGLTTLCAQDLPHYSGKQLNNPDYHHGQLSPALGVHNIGVMRANRERPELADGLGWTYNHAPMLAYWNETFYLEYLANPVGEHEPGGATFLLTSKDGYNWSAPKMIFAPYDIPDGTKKMTKRNGIQETKNLQSVNHQRMGFYVSKKYDKLLVLANLSICLDITDSPNDGNGIGRVVREIKKDGSWSEVHFIRYNHGWDKNNTNYPFYEQSKDKAFVKACDELLGNRLMVQAWSEEADRDDPLIALKGEYKAFNYYHLPNGKTVGWWKHALTAISEDKGETWTKPTRAPGFVNGNAKFWGQKTIDGKYAAAYNPSDFRWPMALSVSDDGLEYTNLLLLNGEVSPMRYGGNYKSYGPQYVRGILEGNGIPDSKNMWLTYSMNKEDIWITKVPVPVEAKETKPVDDIFAKMPYGKELDRWNIFSPVWAKVKVEKDADGIACLTLNDRDEFDYAKAERLFPCAENVIVEFKIAATQNHHGHLDFELTDEKGTATMRLTFNAEGKFQQKNGYRMRNIMDYEAGKVYDIKIELTCGDRFYHVYVDGERKSTGLCFAPVQAVERVRFRTGGVRRFPDVDTPTDQDYDLEQNGNPIPEARFLIYSLSVK